MEPCHVGKPSRARLGRLCRTLVPVALAFILQACGSQELEPWHTAELTAEFSSARAGEVRSFDDYLALEEALFQELDEKVYAKTETGPRFALARYSPGSAVDPRGRQPDWNRSFDWPAEAPRGGVLLLHGLTDAPHSLRHLGKALHARGYWVLGLRLPGHGTAPSGLKQVTWRDMTAAVRLAARHIHAGTGGAPLHVIGYSTGAALALNLALETPKEAPEGEAPPLPASLVLISPAVGLHPAAALAGFKTGLSAFPGLGNLAWLQIAPEFDPYKYNSFATNAGAQVHRLTRSVAQRLRERAAEHPGEVLPPTLVFKSTVDATVSNEALITSLLARLAPHRHELVLFDINRFAVKSKLMVEDPGTFTERLRRDEGLPFAITFVTNESPKSGSVVAERKEPYGTQATSVRPLGLAWPEGVISLSHVALPIPPGDPLYGQRPPDNEEVLFLGQMALQGERGLLPFPADWLLRLRHNPFYDFLEELTLAWIGDHSIAP